MSSGLDIFHCPTARNTWVRLQNRLVDLSKVFLYILQKGNINFRSRSSKKIGTCQAPGLLTRFNGCTQARTQAESHVKYLIVHVLWSRFLTRLYGTLWTLTQTTTTDVPLVTINEGGRAMVHTAKYMMTSSNGNFFRVTGFLCGEFTGHRWIPRTKASDAELWCFFDLHLNQLLSKQRRRRWFETPSLSLWRHCSDNLSAISSTKTG